MQFYAWIPHIADSFRSLWPEKKFIQQFKILSKKIENSEKSSKCSFKVHTDDKTNGSDPILMNFIIPNDFQYKSNKSDFTGTPIRTTIEKDQDKIILELNLYIEDTGLVIMEPETSIEIPDELKDPHFSIEDCDDSNRESYLLLKKYRRYCREIFFKIKSMYHTDTHHNPDYRNKNGVLDGPDEMSFSVSYGQDLERSIEEFCSRTVNTLQSDIEELWKSYSNITNHSKLDFLHPLKNNEKEKAFHNLYCYSCGFITYGKSFINQFGNIISKEKKDAFEASLDCYRESVENLYNAHTNTDSHFLNSAIKVLTVIAVIIAVIGIVIP